MSDEQGLSATTKWVLVTGGLLLVVLLVFGSLVDRYDKEEPEPVDPRNVVWAGMTTSERVDFCAEARAAGYTVVAAELTSNGDRDEQRDARYWLEDRCG